MNELYQHNAYCSGRFFYKERCFQVHIAFADGMLHHIDSVLSVDRSTAAGLTWLQASRARGNTTECCAGVSAVPWCPLDVSSVNVSSVNAHMHSCTVAAEGEC